MLTDGTDAADCSRIELEELTPSASDIAQLQTLMANAERPLMIVGGSRWTAGAAGELASLAETWQIPVAVSFRRQMLFPADHGCFAGDVGFGINPALAQRIRSSDLLILLGSRMSEVPSQGYTLIDSPKPQQTLVHIHPDATEFGRVYQPDLAILATPSGFVRAASGIDAAASIDRREQVASAHRDYVAWSDPSAIRTPGRLQMSQVMSWLNDRLPADAILCNGAGNYASWIHRFYRFNAYSTQLAPTSGSMGYGVPAAVAAKRLHPDRLVVAFAGDGCFLMNGQEFATAVQYDLPIIVIVIDNGMYGTIRAHQEREFPGRISATDLHNPDFAAYAQAFGGHGERVETAEEFAAAFERAVAAKKPTILHCILDREAISPTMTLSAIREASLARS
jgi:acetolactate synthase-1/2/3 large subunit